MERDERTSRNMINIGNRLELFVDKHVIEELRGARLNLAEPKPAGMALDFKKPWEGTHPYYFNIVQDGKKCMMYYRGVDSEKLGEVGMKDGYDREWTCYAESADGTRTFDGMNQAFWSEHEQCYVMYYRQHTVGDTLELVTTDKHRAKYAKTVARTTSPDFVNWSERHMLDWDGRHPTDKECLYCNGIRPYFRAPHIYIGLATRFMQGRTALTEEQAAPLAEALVKDGWQDPRKLFGETTPQNWLRNDCNDTCMITSRGGDKVDRTFREAFVRPGIGYNNWTSRTNYTALGVVQTGPAELSLYTLRNYAQADPWLERLTIRLDGFASVNAPYEGGELLTKPFQFTGKELIVNYTTGAAGFVKVEIQEDNPTHEFADPEPPGRSIPGFTADDCGEIIGDEIEHVVR